MRHFYAFTLTILLFFAFSCKKEDSSNPPVTNDTVISNENTSSEEYKNSTLYAKYQVWIYSNESDTGKAAKDVKDKMLLEFGNKVIVEKSKKIANKIYLNLSLPDKTTYWASKDHFTEKFITVNQPDVLCYKQPDVAYINSNIKLQPGDFAYFVKEQDGFINVDLISYMPRFKKDQVTWIGNVWIKEGFTDDLKIARESYILARAYNDLYGKKNDKEGAIQKLKEALDINGGEETEVTYVIKILLNELTEITTKSFEVSDDIK